MYPRHTRNLSCMYSHVWYIMSINYNNKRNARPNIKKFATSIYFHWTTKIRSLLFSIQFISVVNEFIAMIDWENIFKMLNIIWGKVIWYLQAFEHSLFVRFIMIRAPIEDIWFIPFRRRFILYKWSINWSCGFSSMYE